VTDTIGQPPFAPADLSSIVAREDARVLTFGEWEDHANRLAASLAERGLGPGDAIAVRVHTRLEWLVINLAIAKLGAVLVAVNYRLTGVEVLPILKDRDVVALILDDHNPTDLLSACTALQLRAAVSLDAATPDTLDYAELIASGDPTHRPADDLARMIIYSSGTTGAPKGVPTARTTASPHVMAEYTASVCFHGVIGSPGSRTLVNLPMHHGVGPTFARIALATRGELFLQRDFDPERTLALIDTQRITHWTAVPTMLQRILNLPADVRARYDTRSLRFLQMGGAPAASTRATAARKPA
jgi:long-chain acyl-CoA synthetase